MSVLKDALARRGHDDVLVADGFDEAVVGIAIRCGQPPILVYDAAKCVAILAQQGMDQDEAMEYYLFNVEGAWVGPGTPAFLWPIEEEFHG